MSIKVTKVSTVGYFNSFRPLNRKQYEEWLKSNKYGISSELFYSSPSWRYLRVQTTPLKIIVDYIDDGIEGKRIGEWRKGFTWDVASVPPQLRGIVQYDHPAMIIASLFHDSDYQSWYFDDGIAPTKKGCKRANEFFKACIEYFDEGKKMDLKAWLGVTLGGWSHYKERSEFDIKMTEYFKLTEE